MPGPIEYACDHCQKTLVIPEHLLGKRVRCKFCKGIIKIPEAESEETALEEETPEEEIPEKGNKKKPKAKPCTRVNALNAILFGVGGAILNLILIYVLGIFIPYLLGIFPSFVLLGIVGLIDPRMLDALYGVPGTPWWAYVVSLVAFLAGLGVGVPLVVLVKGG